MSDSMGAIERLSAWIREFGEEKTSTFRNDVVAVLNLARSALATVKSTEVIHGVEDSEIRELYELLEIAILNVNTCVKPHMGRLHDRESSHIVSMYELDLKRMRAAHEKLRKWLGEEVKGSSGELEG